MKPQVAASAQIIVQKIGGSVLAGADSYARVADALGREGRVRHAAHERRVIVVSALQGQTDALEQLAKRVCPAPSSTALDLLWSTGEISSAAVLALALQNSGISAIALDVHQSGLSAIHSCAGYTLAVNPLFIRQMLAQRAVVVVPGFLARGAGHRVVSLGRGGSDLTAVLLTAALGATRCELIKDVSGYFTSDPQRDPAALPLPRLTYAQALAMAADDCDLVQAAALRAAQQAGLTLTIRSLDHRAAGTTIAPSNDTPVHPAVRAAPQRGTSSKQELN